MASSSWRGVGDVGASLCPRLCPFSRSELAGGSESEYDRHSLLFYTDFIDTTTLKVLYILP